MNFTREEKRQLLRALSQSTDFCDTHKLNDREDYKKANKDLTQKLHNSLLGL